MTSPPRGWAQAQAALLADVRTFDRKAGLRPVQKIHVKTLAGERVELWHGLEDNEEPQGQELDVRLAISKLQAIRAGAKQDRMPCRVLKGLYVGGIGAARNLRAMRKAGITHVVNASPVVPCFFRDAPEGAVTYLTIPLFDDEEADLLSALPDVVDFIAAARAQGGGVLVHCYAGQSRSVALAIGYLLRTQPGLGVQAALELVRRTRPCARPNAGFMKQLEQLERERE
ncbi:hypothetical protein APUTEX25_002257 [Auxenochlorella protothecoides]|uniref:protein-tyrosine-phosphatase n=1 Tax=Auxenochlorella protothecoides TaxID=3075 RepID=A0A3M7L4T0_AUXPR|nr:hypothetical protein APUTEX25_002257 [Auxenochlorella protothecoides]|eukprot:RMZ57025.1 hypothetical protein APUTEX25_002257 [Auxenochlorella protothecoides]